MKPVYERWPQEKRTLWFGPLALGLAFVAFLLSGFIFNSAWNPFLVALFVGPILGVAGAWALVGWPKLVSKSGKPLIAPKHKPWLFFPLFFLGTALVYVLLGVFLTPVLPPSILAYVTLAIALISAGAGSFLLVGFPDLTRSAREAWRNIPDARKPWFFFPIAIALTLALYFVVGLALDSTPMPVALVPLIALPLALAGGATAAYFLVGFPKPPADFKERIPRIPARSRPIAFIVTWLIIGAPLSIIVGAIAQAALVLPAAALVPLALGVGYAIALAPAVGIWGTPRKWRTLEGYDGGGLTEAVRRALFLPVFILVLAAAVSTAALAGLELAPAALVGGAIGLPLATRVSGVKPFGLAKTPDLPDMLKPLVLLLVVVTVGGLVFVLGSTVIPGYLPAVIGLALLAGLATGLLLTERALVADFFAERKREKERRAALARVRAQRLEAEAEPQRK